VKNLALTQIPTSVAWNVYDKMKFNDPGMSNKMVEGKAYNEISKSAFDRLVTVRAQLSQLDEAQWRQDFESRCAVAEASMRTDWDINWHLKCSGKLVFAALQSEYQLRIPPLRFKQMVLQEMRSSQTENWKNLLGRIQSVL
jgi:hypothetical protein